MPELAPHVHTEPSLLAYRHQAIPILTAITAKAFSFLVRDNSAPALVAYNLFGRPQSSPSPLHARHCLFWSSRITPQGTRNPTKGLPCIVWGSWYRGCSSVYLRADGGGMWRNTHRCSMLRPCRRFCPTFCPTATKIPAAIDAYRKVHLQRSHRSYCPY